MTKSTIVVVGTGNLITFNKCRVSGLLVMMAVMDPVGSRPLGGGGGGWGLVVLSDGMMTVLRLLRIMIARG